MSDDPNRPASATERPKPMLVTILGAIVGALMGGLIWTALDANTFVGLVIMVVTVGIGNFVATTVYNRTRE